MSVIFCVAVILGGKEILSYRSDAGGGGCEEGGEVGGHCGVTPTARCWGYCVCRSRWEEGKY